MHSIKFIISKPALLLFFMCVILPFGSLSAQKKEKTAVKKITLDEETQRKFDYYYYDALNAKALGKFDEALDYLQHCLALDSTNANMLMELGTFYNVLEQKNKALEFYQKSVTYDPDNYYYNMMLAALSKEMGMTQEVVDIYTFLLKKYPEKVELNFELSSAYADNGELQKAIDALNELEKSFGMSDAITLNKFRLYSMLDKKEDAFKEIRQIIDKNPNEPRYLLLMGDLYMQENNPQKAFPYYEQAKQLDPDLPALTLSMANYYEQTNNKAAAEEELQKAITGAKLDVDTKMQLLTRYIAVLQQNKQDLKSANPLFQTLFDQHPNNTQLNLLYGNVLMLQDNKSEALKQFEIYTNATPEDPTGYAQILRILLPDSLEKVIEITETAMKHLPKEPQFYFYNGGAKLQQGKYKEALAAFEEGLKNAEFENPLVESDFYGQVGDINHAMGKDGIAFENYEKALKLNPQNLAVLNNYSYYLSLQRKDLDKAERMSGITVKAESTNSTYLDTYGWILFEQGAYAMAKIYIEKAVEYGKEEPSAEVHEHYGDVLFKTGEKEKAVEQWKRAKELGSDSKTLNKKIKTGEYIEK